MKLEIKNSLTRAVQFTAEVYDEKYSIQLGLAVVEAIKVGANLTDANLGGAYLAGAYLRGATLQGAYLEGADLRGADLEDANLVGADLRGANLRGTYLDGANLEGAYLSRANLVHADLGGLILFARAMRSDGFEYFGWTSVLGGIVIKAGCREWVGEDAIQQARMHCETTTLLAHRKEALSIIAHIERMM